MDPIIVNLATAAMTVTAAVLAVISLRAWKYTRSPKVLMLAIGFVIFFVKGVVLSLGLFLSVQWGEDLILPSVLLDLAILAVFYAAVLHRGRK